MPDLAASGSDRRDQGHPRRERAIARLAGRQHGALSYRQLTTAGLSKHAIHRRIASGRLHPLHRGVYALGHLSLSADSRRMAAVLACGDGAVVSHRDAAALWAIRPSSAGRIHVTAPVRGRCGPPGVGLHCVRALHPDDRAQCDGIPLTSVARTLLDLAELLEPGQLERAVEQAERLRIFDLRAVDRLRARSRGRHGLKPLAAVLSRQAAPPPDTWSELEQRFFELCREGGLPLPALNVVVEGYVVGAFWADVRLIVELDGYQFHASLGPRARPARDVHLQLAGYRVLRFTYRRLATEPQVVIELVRAALTAQ